MFNFITKSMLLTCILLSLSLLTSSSSQNQDPLRRSRTIHGNVIAFPGEVNSGTEENEDGLEEFYNNPADKLWVAGDPENAYNTNKDIAYESLDDFDETYPDSEPFNFISEEDYVDLPDWMGGDLDELSLDKLELLNSATDLSDLAGLFELDYENSAKLTGQSNITQPDDLGIRLGSESKSSNVVEKKESIVKIATCSPEEVSVELPVPKTPVHLPSCVRLKRCGGCCNNDLLQCQPTKIEEISIKVVKIPKSRSRRKQRGLMVLLTQENHVECSCQCKVQKKDCDPLLHNYDNAACSCACKNEFEQSECEQNNSLHYWDKNLCKCVCRKEKECSTGELYSQNTCGCVAAINFADGGA